MSYALTIDRVELGPDFEAALRRAVAMACHPDGHPAAGELQLPLARQDEHDGLYRIVAEAAMLHGELEPAPKNMLKVSSPSRPLQTADAEKIIARVAHVPELFDRQIEAGIKSAAAYVAAGGLGAAKAARVQIGGHVEADGSAQANVHLWPVP